MASVVYTAGIDVGSSSVKSVLLSFDAKEGRFLEQIGARLDKIRRGDPKSVIEHNFERLLAAAGIERGQIGYIATTGDGDLIDFATGHFYGMTTHARGALHLIPEARAVLDIGALHTRAMRIDARSKVLNYSMTSQCASGSGQFLENIVRYLGITLEEVGELSMQADRPETVSSICAVLAETDVINMVSRGITPPNILKGIHLSMAGRYAKLLRACKAEGVVALTGGLANDKGLVAALQEKLDEIGVPLALRSHPDSIYAGALGAALWGAFRMRKLKRWLPLEAASA
ncbi:MAG: benzoyl-CoA reductase subunit D [Deltaproteobacteria bacterium]|nr:MAG: benzoyl-CoA reductase subunit D [Deltaproteobacteria bacterium]